MKKTDLMQLINQDKASELYLAVFDQKLPDSSGDGTYTQVMSADEETALVRKALSKEGHEADPWLEIIQEYSRKYALSNEAVQVLLNNLDDSRATPLLIDVLSSFGYNEAQGIALCNIVLQNPQSMHALRILQLLYESARVFSPDVYRLLERIDTRIHEFGYAEQAQFAESYKQAIESHKKMSKD